MKVIVGEMSVDDLRDTCLDLRYQKAVKITSKDVKKSANDLSVWHSKKQEAREFRRKYMMEYVPDIQDIST